jgi:hypothetical protein
LQSIKQAGKVWHMNFTTAQKIKTLLEIKTANYLALGFGENSERAAKCAVMDTMNMFKTQMMFIDQLLDQEIEDLIKAGKAA